jgi:hypothetical protein
MPRFAAALNDDMLRQLVETLTESGQAICLYDADDQLRYANKTYQDMFLGNQRARSPSRISFATRMSTDGG